MGGKVSGVVTVACLLAFVGIAFLLRVIPPFDQVFNDGWVKFTSPDSYAYMRQVDNLVPNFPNLMPVDPYFWLTGADSIGELNLFVYLLSAITLLIGAGSPTPGTVDLVGVYFPAVIGALTLVPGYFLGKALFNRWGGLLTAGLLAIMPGEYLGKSELGNTDRDCLQVFLVVTSMLFTVLAVKYASENDLFAGGSSRAGRGVIMKVSVYSLLAGISLVLFLLAWKGAFIFSGIILVFIVLQSVIDTLKGRPANYLFFTGTIIFLSATLAYLPFVQNTTYRELIMLEFVTVIAVALVSWVVVKMRLRPFLYPVILVVLGAGLLFAASRVFPYQFAVIKGSMDTVLAITELDRTVSENLPILFPAGQFTLYVLWVNYTTGFYLSLIGAGILAFLAARGNRPGFTLVLVWSITILLLTLMMRRFALFYAVNVALLSAFICLQFFGYLGIVPREFSSPAAQPRAVKRGGRDKKLAGPSGAGAPVKSVVLGWLPVLLLVFLPNIPTSIYVSGILPFTPGSAWCQSLDWLKNNTPDPFGDPTFYYKDYTGPAASKDLNPGASYAVTAWWDKGYWIVRTAHRLPNCHPGGGNREGVAKFFTEQDVEDAYRRAGDLSSRYVMLDNETVTGMSYILLHAGVEREQFFDGYYRPVPGTTQLEPVVLYHPEYYRSLAVRLYNFDGEAVSPRSCKVIAWEERMSVEGKYKHLVSSRDFQDYDEAVKFISAQKPGNYRIVGEDPFSSPVPLARVSGYRLAFSSEAKIKSAGGVEMPEVKVFEYIK